jgi:hypothetical protein
MAATQEQLIKEIEGLKKFLPIKYYLLFTLLFLVGGFAVEGLFTMLLDKNSFAVYLYSYDWKHLVWMGAWWFGIGMLERRYRQQVIRKKEAELQNLQALI